MSKFSEKCKELLIENGYNVYRLSQAKHLWNVPHFREWLLVKDCPDLNLSNISVRRFGFHCLKRKK